MNLSLLLHLYQPPTQDLSITKEIAESCYLPLLKLIKQKKKLNITFNIPLSLIEQMDALGYKNWINDIKELYESGRLELTGSAAYHPLLSKIVPLNNAVAEQQVILNEYGLGYYFGKDKGFEGESALVLRDLRGFFPPELAVNDHVVELVSGLGYEWMLVDEVSIPASYGDSRFGVYTYKESPLKILVRNRALSNLLSFKRNLNIDDFMSLLRNSGDSVVALDAEYFGHHHKDGAYLFDILIEEVLKSGVTTLTCTEFVNNSSDKNLNELKESTWATSDTHMSKGDIYPNWAIEGNKAHEYQWDIVSAMLSCYSPNNNLASVEGLENFPVWKLNDYKGKLEGNLFETLYINMLVLKSLNSDQFWWASKNPFRADGMVLKSLQLFEEISSLMGDKKFEKSLIDSSKLLKTALEN